MGAPDTGGSALRDGLASSPDRRAEQAAGEVAAEFNRYSRTVVEIDDPTLRVLPVSGRFDAYDTESFAKFLESLDGVAVEHTALRIRVVGTARAVAERPPAIR